MNQAAAYFFFGLIGMIFFAFGAAFQIMPDELLTVLAACIIAIPFALQMIAERRAKQARQRLLRVYAATRGWPFEPTGSLSPGYRFHTLPFFDRGQNRQAINNMHCAAQTPSGAIPMIIGDYDFEVSRGKHTKQFRLSYMVARLPVRQMPKLVVRREAALDRVKSAVGFDDIDFESKVFSDQFHVSSPDKRFAYRMITPRTMEYLMRSCPAPGPPAFCAGGNWIGIMSTHTRWSIFEIDAARN